MLQEHSTIDDNSKAILLVSLEAKPGYRVSIYTGELQTGFADRMSTLHFYKANKGSKLHLLSSDYEYAIATYSLDRDMTYIYTYAYQKEENWTSYNHDLAPESYGQQDYEFGTEVYFRVNIRRKDGASLTEEEAEKVNEILQYKMRLPEYAPKNYFIDEIKTTASGIHDKRTADSMVFAILTDTHYTVNGTWEDTAYNINALHREIGLDAIIHLGDFTDGMVSAGVTKDYVDKQLNDLSELQIPTYFVLGNHDSNYFYNNPERMSKQEQQDFYFKKIDDIIERKENQSYYYVDFDKIKLRGIFLDSYDFDENVKYGFASEELEWLQETLDDTAEGYSVIVFSHVPPLARLHFWSDTIRNSELLMDILEAYDAQEGKCVLAYIHGHNHADQIYLERKFPIVSIGCAKCEYFTDKKPEGSYTYSRNLTSGTQELWDTMIVTPAEKRIDFVRFGAGEDRTVISES